MRIAQIAPLWESVPPRGYGAIESVVADLTGGLAQRGHEVTVFASGDSEVAGNLVAVHAQALHAAAGVAEPEVYRMLQLVEIVDRGDEYDVIHSHIHSNTGCLGIPLLHGLQTPVVHTVHCFFNRDNTLLFERFGSDNYVAISNSQRARLSGLNYVGTVHHGLDLRRFPFVAAPDDPPYVAFLGRIRPEKGVHHAIEVARRAGLRLKLAGRVKAQDREYFEREIAPQVDGRSVVFLGELDMAGKTAFLGEATASLSLSCIPEPFGLAAIESMACGTPVLALAGGAADELVEDGRTGFVRTSVDGLVDSLRHIAGIDRRACRSRVAQHFSAGRMVDQYESIFHTLASHRPDRATTVVGRV